MTRRGISPVALAGCVLALGACGEEGDPAGPAASDLAVTATVAIPPNYGIHDTFVRDGLAFVSAWNSGVIIYDVGHGIAGGSPSDPREVSRLVTDAAGLGGARVHNAWWFHNPNTGERRYLFVGQEGPGQIGASATGDLHVVDVSDLEHPVQVGQYHLDGAGAHNVWMDEQAEVLFAAFYNGGVVAFDVSGTLPGDLSVREIDRILPAADSTFVWGVQVHNGSVYATDMLNGFYQIGFTGTTLTRASGGGGIAVDRFTSDLWLHGNYAYTGTWGTRGASVGNAVSIWRLGAGGTPLLAATLEIDGIGTVGDLEVSADGATLLVAAERGPRAGVLLYALTDPEDPQLIAESSFLEGAHTATFGTIEGRLYVFAAKNPPQPALLVFEVEQDP